MIRVSGSALMLYTYVVLFKTVLWSNHGVLLEVRLQTICFQLQMCLSYISTLPLWVSAQNNIPCQTAIMLTFTAKMMHQNPG